jgi:hypothetical protein
VSRLYAAILFFAALAFVLQGCVTVASIHVDGQRGRTYVVPFGGVAIARGNAAAIGVKQIDLGLWRSAIGAGIGINLGTAIVADPRTCGVALLDGPPSRDLAQIAHLSRAICLHAKDIPNETPVPSFGGDSR